MNIRSITCTIATLLILCACAEQESEQGAIPEGYKSAVEKAKGVESTLEDSAKMHGEKMEESQN